MILSVFGSVYWTRFAVINLESQLNGYNIRIDSWKSIANKETSFHPVITALQTSHLSSSRSSYSKLAIYHSGFRNSLMLHSMPLSYGFTNLTSESDRGCSFIWNSGYFFQLIWKISPFSYKKQLTRRRPAIDERRLQSMGNLKLPTHLSWCWSRCNICATSRIQSARGPGG